MNTEDVLLFLVMPVAFGLAASCAFFLGKNKSRSGMTALVFLWAAFTVVLFLGVGYARGLDYFDYLVALVVISAPVGAGVLIGGPIGWFRKDKASNE